MALIIADTSDGELTEVGEPVTPVVRLSSFSPLNLAAQVVPDDEERAMDGGAD